MENRKLDHRVLTLIVLMLPLISCGQRNASLDEELKTIYKYTVPLAQPADLTEWKHARILDTREQEEFAVSHIPHAKCVGYDDFDIRSLANVSRTDTIVVYCSVGYRSERIGEKLQAAGFKHVFNLYGGIFNWKNTNRVVVDQKNDTTEKVHTYNKSWSRFLLRGEKVY